MRIRELIFEQEFADIIKAVKANAGVVINDHTGKRRQIQGVARHIMDPESITMVPLLMDVKGYSLNGLYIAEDGLVHISRIACGHTRNLEEFDAMEKHWFV